MKTRVISAVVLILLVLACFFISPITRAVFLAAVCIMAIWEMFKAVKLKEINCIGPILYIYTIATAAALFFKADTVICELLFFLAAFSCITSGIVKKEIGGMGALISLSVLVYPVVPIMFILRLSLMENNMWIPVFALACISTWVCDSFALFGGKWFGKHKLAPLVSPNKTIEGTATGAFSSVITGVILYFVLKSAYDIPVVVCILTALISSSLGQIGDLAASLIKRMVGLKDYSNLIPGHGGVMDRIDSLLFSIPSAYFCLYFAGII